MSRADKLKEHNVMNIYETWNVIFLTKQAYLLRDFQLKVVKNNFHRALGFQISRFHIVFPRLVHHHCALHVLSFEEGKRVSRFELALALSPLAA